MYMCGIVENVCGITYRVVSGRESRTLYQSSSLSNHPPIHPPIHPQQKDALKEQEIETVRMQASGEEEIRRAVQEHQDSLKLGEERLQQQQQQHLKSIQEREMEMTRFRASAEQKHQGVIREHEGTMEHLTNARKKTAILKAAAKKFKLKVEKEKQQLTQNLNDTKQRYDLEHVQLRESHEKVLSSTEMEHEIKLRKTISEHVSKHSKNLESLQEEYEMKMQESSAAKEKLREVMSEQVSKHSKQFQTLEEDYEMKIKESVAIQEKLRRERSELFENMSKMENKHVSELKRLEEDSTVELESAKQSLVRETERVFAQEEFSRKQLQNLQSELKAKRELHLKTESENKKTIEKLFEQTEISARHLQEFKISNRKENTERILELEESSRNQLQERENEFQDLKSELESKHELHLKTESENKKTIEKLFEQTEISARHLQEFKISNRKEHTERILALEESSRKQLQERENQVLELQSELKLHLKTEAEHKMTIENLFEQSECSARNLQELNVAKDNLSKQLEQKIQSLHSDLENSRQTALEERSRLMKRISEVEDNNAEELKRLSEKGDGDSTLHAEALEMMRKVLTQEKESAVENLRAEMRDKHSQFLRKEQQETLAMQRLEENRSAEMKMLKLRESESIKRFQELRVEKEAECKKLRDKLFVLRSQHEQQSGDVKSQYKTEFEVMRERSRNHITELQLQKDMECKNLQDKLSVLRAQHEQQSGDVTSQYETELKVMRENLNSELESLRSEHKRISEENISTLEAAHEMQLQEIQSSKVESAHRQLAQDLSVARLAETREVKQVRALTEALSICREIERKQRDHALEEASELKQYRESNADSTSTLCEELETERRKVKKLEEDLVQACASVAAYQTKLSELENGTLSNKKSGGGWNIFSGGGAESSNNKIKNQNEPVLDDNDEDLIDFGDSPIVTNKKKTQQVDNDVQGDVVVHKTAAEIASRIPPPSTTKETSKSGWGFGNLFGNSSAASEKSTSKQQPKIESVEIDVLFGKGPMGIELKPFKTGGTYVVRLSKPSLLGDTSWALKYNQYILKKVGDRSRLLIPGMRPVSVNGTPLPSTLKDVAKVFKSTKRPMKIKFLPPLKPGTTK